MSGMDSPKIAIASDFLLSFAAIPKAQQKKVQEFLSKFRENPTSSAINYEKIRDAKSKNVHSVRIDQAYRGIVLKPDKGNVYMLMFVALHDDAYDWARNHRCEIHPSTGSIQVIDVSKVEAAIAQPKPEAIEKTKPIFSEFKEKQILALGVPQSFIQLVMTISSERELEQLEDRLPTEAFEALFMLAAGDDYESVYNTYNDHINTEIDVDDFDAALQRAVTQRSFKVVTDDLELQKMLNAPLEQWRVFLHPSQRKLVSMDAKGPTRVLGGAGTGKTVVAMHRAVHLANKLILAQSNRKILFTTFTKNLASDIKANIKKIATDEQLARIEVANIDGWVSRLLKQFNYDYKVVYDGDFQRKKCWDIAVSQAPADPYFPDSFYQEEWRLIVQAHGIKTKQDYLKVSRVGRGTSLNRIQRSLIWPVFEEYRNQLNRNQIREINDAMLDAMQLINEQKLVLPYTAVIVDEAQDMGSQAFTLLRSIVPEQENDLFIVGDGHQRIYRNKVVLSRCGINVRGRRSQKLKINYRTTEETRRFATAILENVFVDDLDGEFDKSTDYLSLFHGDAPVVQACSGFDDECKFIRNQIGSLTASGVPLKNICIVSRTNPLRDNYKSFFEQAGFEVYALSSESSDNDKPGLRFATMHRVKGLEFQYIFIAGANEGVIPLQMAITEDPVEKRDYDFNERALLHVAATRAIKGLVVTSSGVLSDYLKLKY
ncbi:UvrD-helicase domain-containing protein [Shewanella sp. SP2S2-4]|uniref:UvrD-helicase domain-containing protein n=1 Tax=Shewanella sp. SP2S2-4 TaxID=3063539 RepID=UPI00288DA3E9|nr:UvrD-helicase domain-containing protein [Shewanella sp. SP2S2-4]MDT3272875.1 UvrD-helicase domain-containing protein [Shewanella sp. SP2S2-4]